VGVDQDLVREGDGATERFVEVASREHSAVVKLNEPERLNVLSAPNRTASRRVRFQQAVRSMTEKD
jgi:hypothetical protein